MSDVGKVAVSAPVDVEYASIGATVIRCGCGDPLSHAEMQLPCPRPRAVEERGIISEYRRPGPFRRWMTQLLKGGR